MEIPQIPDISRPSDLLKEAEDEEDSASEAIESESASNPTPSTSSTSTPASSAGPPKRSKAASKVREENIQDYLKTRSQYEKEHADAEHAKKMEILEVEFQAAQDLRERRRIERENATKQQLLLDLQIANLATPATGAALSGDQARPISRQTSSVHRLNSAFSDSISKSLFYKKGHIFS